MILSFNDHEAALTLTRQHRDWDIERENRTWESRFEMASQASVQECEAYIEQHGIQAILKECIAKICQERPAKPYKWLREYFEKLEKVRSSSE